MATGRLILESLRVGSLDTAGLTLTALERVEVPHATSTQPSVWSLLDVAFLDDVADRLLADLSDLLDPAGHWYADFEVGDDHVVVYPGRVFRYQLGDSAGLAEAVAHGRSLGIPEDQLDWDTDTT